MECWAFVLHADETNKTNSKTVYGYQSLTKNILDYMPQGDEIQFHLNHQDILLLLVGYDIRQKGRKRKQMKSRAITLWKLSDFRDLTWHRYQTTILRYVKRKET
ncbi:CLUMA_CG010638, isoform A [Clunio marinus]|uniref:CLUMA_CG010638, isoform A n=1 Tax=Clunio marinus TaxID=568069 RepID=A0A1J1IBW8_9DIPT|nr:CLUMA_CG010638, isoform A [Clunio marinus]